jgi:SAM-dependent methyltransferase
MAEEESYAGVCNVCGTKGYFIRGDARSVREGFACTGCRASLRYRDQAALIVDEFARGRTVFLRHMVGLGLLSEIDIYEPALHGPFVNMLKGLPRYVRSYYWPDRPKGSVGAEGARCEDLTALSFPDDSFDLVITSDVMEHIYDIGAAFSEITRVLKPGGVHVFTIPNDWPFPERSEPRVEIVGGEERHLKPARYHTGGDGTPCIVYHDYGADLLDMIDATGCRTQAVRRHSAFDPGYVNATFVSRKLGGA